MPRRLPDTVLFSGEKPFPVLPAVDHYAGAEKLMRKQSYTSIMGNIGASSAIISRVSRVLGRDDSVLRRILEKNGVSADTED